MTDIYNRHYLIQWGSQGLERARRNGTHLGILMMDLDHFKVINDVHGHLAEDEVLRSTVKCLQAGLRDGDILGRYGGDEFIAFFPGVDLPAVIHVAERLRQQIEKLIIPFDEHRITITASFGIHVFHGKEVTSLDELLQIADQALYQAKNGGRNRVASLS